MLFRGDSAREEIDRLRYLRARRSICALGDLTISSYRASWHHKLKARYLEDVIKYARFRGKRGGTPRLLISEPPQHGKSLHADLAAAIALGQDPDLTVIATAYGAGLATERAENTRAIMNTAEYKRTFATRVGSAVDSKTGKQVQAKDQASFFKTLLEHPDGAVTPARGHYYAAGIGGGLTGHGFRFGVMDDWVKDESEALSYAALGKRIGVYTKAFETRMQGVGAIVAIGTMWDNPDWLDWLWDLWTDQGHDPIWLKFPALTDEFAPELHPEDPREPLSDLSLWPARYPSEEQRKKRAGLLSRDKNAWCALQQQNPIRIAGQMFPKTAWQWFSVTGDQRFDLQQLDDIHLSVDGNVKETGSSFAVIAAYGTLTRWLDGAAVKHYFRLDESRGHYEFSELRDETLRLWDKWRTRLPAQASRGRVWVEDKANGPALMSQLAGRGIPFRAVPKTRSKLVCYRMAQIAVMENRVWLPLDSDGHVTHDWAKGQGGFVEELATVPGEPDDRADEFAQMVICNDPNMGIDLLSL